jgi:quercetin dioxygenase-like cupin family protein
MQSTEERVRAPRIIPAGDGRYIDFLNHLATIKVEGGPGSALSVVEFDGPRGYGPPLHRHHHEDELFVVLEGELAFLTDAPAGAPPPTATAGGMAFLPHGMTHGFQVLSETARFVCVTGSGKAHPRFDAMVAAIGVETTDPTVRQVSYIDATRLADICLEHDIDIVGPPPAPLD